MPGLSPAVRALLIINGVVFLAGLLLPNVGLQMHEWFAYWFPRNEHFRSWQLVTYMFMHGSIAHIFFNMFALVSFGLPLEQQWSTRRFFVFYFLCGIGAALVHLGISWANFVVLQHRLMDAGVSAPIIDSMLHTGVYNGPRNDPAMHEAAVDLYRIYAAPMVGASGAIYGVLVAFGMLFPNAKLALLFLPFPIAAKYFIPILVAIDLFSGVTGFSLFGGGVAHFAHIGGALIGLLLMWHWRRRVRRPSGAGAVIG